LKKQTFLILVLLVFIAEIIALCLFSLNAESFPQDTVEVNVVVKTVTEDFHSLQNHENKTSLNYVVTDNTEKVLFKTSEGLNETINEAISHRDTILDIVIDGAVEGKIIIYNDEVERFRLRQNTAVIVFSVATALQGIICIAYAVYIYLTVIKPFKKMKNFAKRVAVGNLEIPLEMDRGNLFGAFTESFDVMRSELKKARISEAQAKQSKKELVAKLSHDIKTPVASIKAVSEVGLAVTDNEKDKANYLRIIEKADRINSLVTNLFTATLEELEQLTVTPKDIESKTVKRIMENADYLKKAVISDIPECLIYADELRLQQVFDNVFFNSYKYANTEITVSAEQEGDCILITVEDYGGGVKSEELPFLKEKFKRGSNAVNIDGAGLGLYISDYFLKEMGGELSLSNGEHGLMVSVKLKLSGKQ